MSAALHGRALEIAEDIGRLNRLTEPDSYISHIADRLASGVDSLLLMLEPTAAQLAGQYAPGDAVAISEAIRIVDARHTVRRELLGLGG